LHVRLLFTVGAADFTSDQRHRRQAGGLIKPAGKDNTFVQVPGFLCQDYEDGLGDFFGAMGVARMAQRDRVDLVDVPCNEQGKRFFGSVLHVFPQQRAVTEFLHPNLNAAEAGKVTVYLRSSAKSAGRGLGYD
jgi:hypothetical protein